MKTENDGRRVHLLFVSRVDAKQFSSFHGPWSSPLVGSGYFQTPSRVESGWVEGCWKYHTRVGSRQVNNNNNSNNSNNNNSNNNNSSNNNNNKPTPAQPPTDPLVRDYFNQVRYTVPPAPDRRCLAHRRAWGQEGRQAGRQAAKQAARLAPPQRNLDKRTETPAVDTSC